MLVRAGSPSDVCKEQWSFAAPDLTLMTAGAPQCEHDLREVYDGLHWIVRTDSPRCELSNVLRPWQTIHQQPNAGSSQVFDRQSFKNCAHLCGVAKRKLTRRQRQSSIARSGRCCLEKALVEINRGPAVVPVGVNHR
jgi:transposase